LTELQRFETGSVGNVFLPDTAIQSICCDLKRILKEKPFYGSDG
jgi:hypothetical protein